MDSQARNPAGIMLGSALRANASVPACVSGCETCSCRLLCMFYKEILTIIRAYGVCNSFHQRRAFIQRAGAGLVEAICGQCLESHSAPVCSSFEYHCNARYCDELTTVSNFLWGLKFLCPEKYVSLPLYDVSRGL